MTSTSEWLRSLLRDNLIVKLKPAKLRDVVGAGTARGQPVSFPLTITVDPAMRLDRSYGRQTGDAGRRARR
jgi:hypothetical protein